MYFVTNYWWVYLLRGIFAILFGLAALFWPGLTLTILVVLFSIYLGLQGIFLIFTALNSRGISRHWWLALVEGGVCLLIAILAFAWPGITAMALLFIIAFWAFITGVIEVYSAVHLRKVIQGEWVLGLSGILSLIFAIILVVYPSAGALAVLWIIGIYAILFGLLTLYLASKLRNTRKIIRE